MKIYYIIIEKLRRVQSAGDVVAVLLLYRAVAVCLARRDWANMTDEGRNVLRELYASSLPHGIKFVVAIRKPFTFCRLSHSDVLDNNNTSATERHVKLY